MKKLKELEKYCNVIISLNDLTCQDLFTGYNFFRIKHDGNKKKS